MMSVTLLLLLTCMLSVAENITPSDSQKVPEGLSAPDWSGIRTAYEAGRHRFHAVETGGYQARNPAQQWQMNFDGRGFVVRPDGADWQWGLELVAYGFAGHELSCASTTAAQVTADESRLTYTWSASLEEWYVNDGRGLEHGYTVRQRPSDSADSPLIFRLAVRGGLRPVIESDGSGVRFVNDRGAVVTYGGLKVWDADGRTITARFQTLDSSQVMLSVDDQGAKYPLTIDPVAQQAYLKASNTEPSDAFGWSVAISGNTVVVGAYAEGSIASGINGDQNNNNALASGAAYVFVRNGGVWTQEAYLKASNPWWLDYFGHSVAISGDTIVVGAPYEDSSGTGVNGVQSNDNATDSGAAYVFVRNGGVWTQQAYLKASNSGENDNFGASVAISGNTVIVGAYGEDSSATGINGSQSSNASGDSGAAYVFVRSGNSWTQQAYLKASNTDAWDFFGWSVAISGNTAVVGARNEASMATGVNGDQGNWYMNAGAAYIFVRAGATWTQQAYLKASNTDGHDNFGYSVAISDNTVVIGAPGEDSIATGVDGSQGGSGTFQRGAAYIFARTGIVWSQQAYLKASNTGRDDQFGYCVAISGNTVVVGAPFEDSGSAGINGVQNDDSAPNSGAAYLFSRTDTSWTPLAYVKASNTGEGDAFAWSVAVSADTVLVGSPFEDSSATGINGIQTDDNASTSGAAYAFTLPSALPEIAVSEMGVDLVDGSDAVDFGSVAVGDPSEPKVFEITNDSVATLQLTGLATDGMNPGDFTVNWNGVGTLAPGQNITITIAFAPTAAGVRTATIHFSSNDPDENPFNIILTGAGLNPNRPPVAPEQTFARAPGLALQIPIADLLAACSDPDGDALVLENLGSSIQGASISTNSTYILYSLGTDLDDSFSYQIADPSGATATGTIHIHVLSPGLPNNWAVYEVFEYSPGSDLSGQAGGVGWIMPWGTNNGALTMPGNAFGDTAAPGSLGYTDSEGNGLVASGHRGVYSGESGEISRPFRDIAPAGHGAGADGTTTWISMLIQRFGPTVEGANPYPRSANVAFYDGGTEQFAIGNLSGAPDNNISLLHRGGLLANRRPSVHPFDQLSFAVLRIDHLAGNDNAYFFVNPPLGVEPDIGSADASTFGEFEYTFNRVRPFAGNADPINGWPYAELTVDELRLGDSYADVTPHSAAIVSFADANLDAAVRAALNNPLGPITRTGLASLESLNAEGRGIANLGGLEYAANLQGLRLGINQITDLSPLAGLAKLRILELYGNQITDVSPLAGLTALTDLVLHANHIQSIAPLAGLTNLIHVNLSLNPIVDFSALSGWEAVWALFLDDLGLTDLSFLAEQTQLVTLGLTRNEIEDISPLAGLVNLRELFLSGNRLHIQAGSEAYNLIQTAISQGAAVSYVPQREIVARTQPVALSGWNADVVLENSPDAQAIIFDDNESVWPEAGLGRYQWHHNALPPARQIPSLLDSGVVFELQPYNQANVLQLTTEAPEGILALAQPAQYQILYVLAVSANGGGTGSLILRFEDGSESTEIAFYAPDWWDGTSHPAPRRPAAMGFARNLGNTSAQYDYVPPGFSLHQTDIDLVALGHAGKSLREIVFRKPNDPGTASIFAVSGIRTPPDPAIASLTPSITPAGSPGFALLIHGAHFESGATVLWNGQERGTTYVSSEQLSAEIPATDLAGGEDIITLFVTVRNPNGRVSNPQSFAITLATVSIAETAAILSGENVTVSTAPGTAGNAGVAAVVNNNGGDPVSVTVANYSSNPSGQVFSGGGGFTDLQILGADSSDSATVHFYYPSTLDPATEVALSLVYFNGSVWELVRSDGNTFPLKETADNLADTVSGGRFTVLFSNSSTPAITALGGTIFGVGTINNQPPQVAPDQAFFRGPALTLKIRISDLLSACSDPEGGALSLESVGPSAQGASISRTSTHILYTAAGGVDDSFNYRIASTSGATATGAIHVRVVKSGGQAQSVTPGAGSVMVNFAGIPGFEYDVQRSTDPGGPWLTLTTQIAPANGLFNYTDPAPPAPTAYYRLQQH